MVVDLTWGDTDPPDEEAMALLHRGLELPCNDIGNAHRMMLYGEGEFVFDPGTGWLFRWGPGKAWSRDSDGLQIRRRAHDALDWLWDEVRLLVARGAPAAEIEAHRQHAEASGRSERVDAMIREASPYLHRLISADE